MEGEEEEPRVGEADEDEDEEVGDEGEDGGRGDEDGEEPEAVSDGDRRERLWMEPRPIVMPQITVSAGFSRVQRIGSWDRPRLNLPASSGRRPGTSPTSSYNVCNVTRLLMYRERGGGGRGGGGASMPFAGAATRHVCTCASEPVREEGDGSAQDGAGPSGQDGEEAGQVHGTAAAARGRRELTVLNSFSLGTLRARERADGKRRGDDAGGEQHVGAPGSSWHNEEPQDDSDDRLQFQCAACGTMQDCARTYRCYGEPCAAESARGAERRGRGASRAGGTDAAEASASCVAAAEEHEKERPKSPKRRRPSYYYDPAIVRRYDGAIRVRHTRALVGHESTIARVGLRARLHGHTGCVNTVYIDEETDYLFSGSDDTQVRVWDSVSGAARGFFATGHIHNIFGVKTVPGSGASKCCTVAADGQVRLIDMIAQKDTSLDWQDEIALGIAFVPQCSPVFLASFGDGAVRQYGASAASPRTACVHLVLAAACA